MGRSDMTNEKWGQVRSKLQKAVGQNNYTSWIEPLEFADLDGGVVTFLVPTNFMGNWVGSNFSDQILSHLSEAGVAASRLEFVVPKKSAPRKMTNSATGSVVASNEAQAPSKSAPRPEVQDDLPGAPLDARFTFDSFVVGKPNELAHAAARRVAEGGPVTFNPLFLYGGVGLGKTHLMHAIAHELKARQPDLRVVYLSAEQFMYRFVKALREKQMMDFKQIFRSVDVLMVDDVQFIAGKDSTQEEFFHTFNALVDQNKQIIISADRAPGEIKDLEDRIKSRLQCGLVVDLHPTDYELRLGVLQTKVASYRQQYPGLQIADGVLEFLAHRISTNVRVLEGALMRLFAFASLVGREITLELAQDCLGDILRASDRKVTVEEIQRKVSEHYNIRLSDLIGPKRVRTIARPRQVAMYLAKHMTSRSLPEIGRRFGGRDHTTVMHGVKRIDELKAVDDQIAEDLELLRRALEA
ncbi:Chromosomal replication initiator protein DnaA [Aliiroseovarius sp. xm-m-379]|uniref:chromosomal replication initiator protein DnaA n=2 Tax=unclassified Aliiroseovarius TaxID=2623558 RepID=UPI0015684A4D|nr:Chromosomal replication initiator protein DnaA [Aliiroseovarius sp. xm-d-517]NRP24045.1 Chromosomal replication initiator protein DnaA [Aliiroseovarius sp. xm-m-379]NRP30144.1 Chromosomal replication initiator protein DnaA [Aliiroseovarius sp. xm-m-314]NRP32844.1 Chromosomal replication initiator protein DnaA [Aliiroseovarius sp. xm-a-104]NRP40403.1 Chromosomal replication initiator protein DnaA [Aliiroseovarius sp. xm-m-339-2]NRP49711.1 Chromosomal replication initiator protein DnaA [Aliir